MGSFLAELWAFVRERKQYWLLPVVLVLLLFGSLIVLTEGTTVAPFNLYPVLGPFQQAPSVLGRPVERASSCAKRLKRHEAG